MSASGTTTLGFILWTIAVSLLVWIFGVLYNWRKQQRSATARSNLFQLFASSVSTPLITLAAIAVVTLGTWTVFVVRTIYFDHMDLARAHAADLQRNAQLGHVLEFHRHSVSTTDPVFPNLIYMLQSFRAFRIMIGRESCVVSFSAMGNSLALATTMAQLSIQASNCFTFGPFTSDRDPDMNAQAVKAMLPDAIVFHAAREDKAANSLFDNLGSQIRLVRSYELPVPNYQVPPGGYAHTIWLQFGSDVKWNSERR